MESAESPNFTNIQIVRATPPSYSEIPGTVPQNHGRATGPPPSYEDVVNPEASPPTYQSLFGQVREARKNSVNFVDFLRKVIILLLGTIGCSIILGVAIVVPVSMILVGSRFFGQCPVEQFIPIYLIVGGTFGVVKNLLTFFSRCKKNENVQERLIHRSRDSILNCFLIAWFITGCIWTYRVYEPEYENMESPFYCNKTLYLFAFWLVTTTFIGAGFALLAFGPVAWALTLLEFPNADIIDRPVDDLEIAGELSDSEPEAQPLQQENIKSV